MQSGQALRLVDGYRFPNRSAGATRGRARGERTRRARPAHLEAVAAPGTGGAAKARPAAKARARRGGKEWMRPIVMAVIVAGEWLLLIADVFVHFYLAC